MKPKKEAVINAYIDKQQLIDDIVLIHPELKEQAPLIVHTIQDQIADLVGLGVSTGFQLGFRAAESNAKGHILAITFVAILMAPFFLAMGVMLVGANFFGALLGAGIGVGSYWLLNLGFESLGKLIEEKRRKREEDDEV